MGPCQPSNLTLRVMAFIVFAAFTIIGVEIYKNTYDPNWSEPSFKFFDEDPRNFSQSLSFCQQKSLRGVSLPTRRDFDGLQMALFNHRKTTEIEESACFWLSALTRPGDEGYKKFIEDRGNSEDVTEIAGIFDLPGKPTEYLFYGHTRSETWYWVQLANRSDSTASTDLLGSFAFDPEADMVSIRMFQERHDTEYSARDCAQIDAQGRVDMEHCQKMCRYQVCQL